MTTFLSHEQPTVDAIRAHKYKNNAGGNTAVVEFDREHHSVTNFYIDDPDPARQLLAAAFEAVRILDPDGAADALIGLIEGDALAKIRARILEEDAAEAGVHDPLAAPGHHETCPDTPAHRALMATSLISADVQVCFWCGTEGTGMKQISVVPEGLRWECADAEACRHGNAAFAAPDTAQPEDIPNVDGVVGVPCNRCGSSEFVVMHGDGPRCYNSALCTERQAAKASAR